MIGQNDKFEFDFENDEQFEDFNIWINYNYIIGQGRHNGCKFIVVRNQKELAGHAGYQLKFGTYKFNLWLMNRLNE